MENFIVKLNKLKWRLTKLSQKGVEMLKYWVLAVACVSCASNPSRISEGLEGAVKHHGDDSGTGGHKIDL